MRCVNNNNDVIAVLNGVIEHWGSEKQLQIRSMWKHHVSNVASTSRIVPIYVSFVSMMILLFHQIYSVVVFLPNLNRHKTSIQSHKNP